MGSVGIFKRIVFDFRKKDEMRNLFVLLTSDKQLKLRVLHVNGVFKYL